MLEYKRINDRQRSFRYAKNSLTQRHQTNERKNNNKNMIKRKRGKTTYEEKKLVEQQN